MALTVGNQGSVAAAVHRHGALSASGLHERAFTFAFRDLVYAQIWEDPVVDMEALEIRPDSVIVGIASGGCNLLSYLTATRTARAEARVIFRTAGAASILPGRVDLTVLQKWRYSERRSQDLFARDRSAIYGGFHLYTRSA